MDRRRPTLEEVAAAAGVSRATASRAINGESNVATATKDAVAKAVKDLGYKPNLAARTLVTRRTDAIAVVVAEADQRLFADPFFGRVLHGVGIQVATTERQLMLFMRTNGDSPTRLGAYLGAGHADGAIVISHHRDDGVAAQLAKTGLPRVYIGRPWSDSSVFVDNDNIGGAYAVTKHLIASGARRIGTVCGPLDMVAALDRFSGWRRAMAEANLPDDLVIKSDFTAHGGAQAAEQLLQMDPGCDAIFAASDLMASGALMHLASAGVRVPGDVRVAGFDNHDLSAHTRPALTTVTNPAEELGATAARLLMDLIAGRACASEILPSHVVVRESA